MPLGAASGTPRLVNVDTWIRALRSLSASDWPRKGFVQPILS